MELSEISQQVPLSSVRIQYRWSKPARVTRITPLSRLCCTAFLRVSPRREENTCWNLMPKLLPHLGRESRHTHGVQTKRDDRVSWIKVPGCTDERHFMALRSACRSARLKAYAFDSHSAAGCLGALHQWSEVCLFVKLAPPCSFFLSAGLRLRGLLSLAFSQALGTCQVRKPQGWSASGCPEACESRSCSQLCRHPSTLSLALSPLRSRSLNCIGS